LCWPFSIYNLIESSLTNRLQQVQVNNAYSSEYKEVKYAGVPQDIQCIHALLGLLIFIIYIFNLVLLKCEAQMLCISDDTR